jgi:hypothetical protein
MKKLNPIVGFIVIGVTILGDLEVLAYSLGVLEGVLLASLSYIFILNQFILANLTRFCFKSWG